MPKTTYASERVCLSTSSSSSLPATTMDISFALTGKGYVIVAADTTAARSIVKMKVDEDKIKVLSPHLLMAFSGEPGTSCASCIPCRTLKPNISNR